MKFNTEDEIITDILTQMLSFLRIITFKERIAILADTRRKKELWEAKS